MKKERMQMPDKVIMAIIDVIILIGLIVYCRFVGNEDWKYVILIYLPIALLLVLVGNYIGLLIRKSSKAKPIQVTSVTNAEWENVISKLDVEFVAVTIDCFSYRKKRRHYIENIPKVIDPQKTIFDMTNYPGYVIIYMSNNDDLSTLCETYNAIYRLYGEVTKIELYTGKFYKDKYGEASNEIQFSLKELPILSMHFDQIINSIYI